ncbi:MAG: hypothetical protein PF637_07935 [Spirochaetes bacterium]|jgi:signal transduction histidine kinase|nr:hypothetical protein [Spirochaetota bacterium]
MLDKKTNELIEALTRNLSHEVKNPLTTIKGYAQLIELKSTDEFALKAVGIMNEQIEAIEQQFDSIYSVFQADSKPQVEFDLLSLINASIEGVESNLNIEFASEVSELQLLCDKSKIVRLLDIFLTGLNFEYFDGLQVKMSCTASQIKIAYENITLPEDESLMLFLPFSSKTLFKEGTSFYEIYHICFIEKFELIVENSPFLTFTISLK